MTLPTPGWLDNVPADRRNAAYRRFLLRASALYASEPGHMTLLSEALGLARTSLGTFACTTDGKAISPRVAHGIEKLTGGTVRASELNDDLL